MKKIILILSMIFSLHYVSGQSDSIKIKAPWKILNEYSVSMNYTITNDYITSKGIGFGLGLYHTFMQAKRFNITIGLEYNRTSQLINYMYDGHYASFNNITFTINNLSLPLEVRFNIGNKVKWFIAFGTYLEVSFGERMKGILSIYPMGSISTSQHFKRSYEGESLNFGISCGTGLKIPISKHELIIKPDFRWGFRNLGYDMDIIFNRYVRLLVGFRL